MQDKVSIITPLFNCEKYILNTIKSVQAQTYSNWE
ncbi:MAG: glycosyltransferase, partial [Clostridium perfringens]